MAIFNKSKKDDNTEKEAAPAANVMADPKSADKADGLDFNRYFLAERRIILENVSYETSRPEAGAQGYKLTAKDSIVPQLLGNVGIKVTFNSQLKFEPEGPFVLSVSYSVMLIFNPGTRDEVDWKSVDMVKEFQKNCAPILGTMLSRTALLIAEITSAAGQPPVIMGMPMMKQ